MAVIFVITSAVAGTVILSTAASIVGMTIVCAIGLLNMFEDKDDPTGIAGIPPPAYKRSS